MFHVKRSFNRRLLINNYLWLIYRPLRQIFYTHLFVWQTNFLAVIFLDSRRMPLGGQGHFFFAVKFRMEQFVELLGSPLWDRKIFCSFSYGAKKTPLSAVAAVKHCFTWNNAYAIQKYTHPYRFRV